ncbi:neurofilament heavy polypeptide-like isoform X3 [Trachinotus anak]|uniref:neurofilament heavy polypeptide-like isoform X3 n=1 Tax=Trachinotus anak TaxID=443729 RepID=UPI0039F1E781
MSRRYFLAFYITTSCLVSGQPLTYHLQGTVLHLKPDITGQPDDILWKHDGNKVVDFDGREEQLYGQFQNRVTLDWVSAELSITDLRYDDSGEYELEIVTNKRLHTFRYKVEVIGKVPKPTISCDMNNGNSNTHGTQATLTCSADPQSSMSYEWDSHGEVLPGPNLTISLEGEHHDKTYTCRVSNPLTTETATFTAKNCYSEESSSVALAAGIVGSIILLLLLVLGIVLYRRACFAKRDALEKQREPGTEPLLDNSPQRNHTVNIDMEGGEGLEKNTNKGKKAMSPPCPPGRKPSPCQALDNLPGNDKGEAEADQLRGPSENKVPECDSSDTEKENEPDQVAVLDDSEDTQFEVESSPAPEHPGLEKNTDMGKKAMSPPCPPGRKPSPCQGLDNLPGNDKGEAEADQLRGPSENKVPECDSSDTEKANEPDQVAVFGDSEDTLFEVEPSPAPEHPGNVRNVISKFEANERNDSGQMPPLDTRTEAEADQLRGPSENKVPEFDSSDTEKENEPDQVAVLDDSEDTQSEVEPSAAPELPGYVQNVISKFEPNDGGQMPPLDTRTDAEADQLRGPSENKVPEFDYSDTEKENEPDQVAVFGDSEDTQFEVEPSPAPELPGYVQNVKRKFEPNDGGQMPPLDTRTDAEADQLRGPSENKVPEFDYSDTEKENKPDQVAVLDDSEDTQSEVEPSPAPELPESENEEEKSPPNCTSRPIPRPRSRRTKNFPHMGTKDTAGEHKEDAKSDQVIGETSEKTVRESDSPGSQERNESDD